MTNPHTTPSDDQPQPDEPWRPSGDGELIAWAEGFHTGWDQGYHDAAANHTDDTEGGADQ